MSISLNASSSVPAFAEETREPFAAEAVPAPEVFERAAGELFRLLDDGESCLLSFLEPAAPDGKPFERSLGDFLCWPDVAVSCLLSPVELAGVGE